MGLRRGDLPHRRHGDGAVLHRLPRRPRLGGPQAGVELWEEVSRTFQSGTGGITSKREEEERARAFWQGVECWDALLNPPEQEAQLRLLTDVVARQSGEDAEEVLRRALGVCDQDRRARRYVCAIVAQVVSEIAVQTMVQSDPRRTAAATQAIAHFIGWKPQE